MYSDVATWACILSNNILFMYVRRATVSDDVIVIVEGVLANGTRIWSALSFWLGGSIFRNQFSFSHLWRCFRCCQSSIRIWLVERTVRFGRPLAFTFLLNIKSRNLLFPELSSLWGGCGGRGGVIKDASVAPESSSRFFFPAMWLTALR